MNGGAAQTFAKIASLNTGLSGSVSGTFNYTDANTSNNNETESEKRSFINPINKKRVKKALNIDSRFRDNYYNTNSTDYEVKLPLSFEKVVEMELMHIELPLSYYGITKEKGNNFFWLKVSTETVNYYKQLELPDGNYTSTQIGIEILEQITGTTVTELGSNETFNLDSSTVATFAISLEDYSNKLVFTLAGTDLLLELNFSAGYSEDYLCGDGEWKTEVENSGITEHYNTNSGESLQLKLGWILGYRFGKYSSAIEYTAEALFENPVPRYLYLVVDDYNNNVNNCIYSAFNSSILNKNILVKIAQYGSVGEIYKSYAVDDGQHARTYFGPVNIRKLTIKLLDEYGRQVDLNNMDFSFTLALTCLYD
tara:strand:+ start:1453 stop:2553 length:1101 start_codon:yes stop_codon:yes gene_type:complete